ncbi:E3 ubiquitin-protein ligase WAV3-like isoform X2 [Lotus japonicus]|uniref:E3 ubiquitin-protein ligase WAV3-like isoform X2 n=1 Tax=Lotus japonicus TaxID=34305 RepID=UPI00258C73E7|nr:E3 ubiquitin-protein ligase WAV3-like isoform X2 [Lotus japonicus]
MESRWRKLWINMCVHVPKTVNHSSSSNGSATSFSGHVLTSGDGSGYRATTPTSSSSSSSSGLRLSKSKSSKGTCAICLNSLKAGKGHAIFTAECSHSFHFHCITSNVKHGHQVCPVCRANWKEVPFPRPASNVPQKVGAGRINASLDNFSEPAIFDDDDEVLDQQPSIAHNMNEVDCNIINSMEIKTYPEVSAISKSASYDNFAVLVHLKAPSHSQKQLNNGRNNTESSEPVHKSRAPIDLVTVLDVSGSMAGTKIALLKRAMGFVIQNLSSSDRLSVVAFSSTARRIFPLRQMTETGRQQALQAVNSLDPDSGTNIAEGLKKGVKVFAERKWKNPVGSIMLLSDGQDTYTFSRPRVEADYRSLVPSSIHRSNCEGMHIPVHAFGFGADHDATAMHSISEITGGTFSFIETEDMIQDAFAQCLGGLMSVVVQELQIEVRCFNPCLQLSSVKAGSYQTRLINNARMACIKVGDLYAEEERDFFITMNVPADDSSDEMSLLIVRGLYRDPTTKEMVGLDVTSEVKIQRPDIARGVAVSIEVDKQRNRNLATEAMTEARVKAERGDFVAAVSTLESCQRALSETVSARAGDSLCVSLSAELKEMQERMENRRIYEQSGRAYLLSGISSHSSQRATTRGDSTDTTRSYQTASQVDMITRSQTMLMRTTQPGNSLPPSKSFNDRLGRKK